MYLTETHVPVRDMARDGANDVIRPRAEGLDREDRRIEAVWLFTHSAGVRVDQASEGANPSQRGIIARELLKHGAQS